MTITAINVSDDGSSWVTVTTRREDPCEPTGSVAEVAQLFGYAMRPRGLLRDITDQQRARRMALELAQTISRRHGGVPIQASWWATAQGAA